MTAAGGLLIDVSPLRASREFRCAFAARLVSVLGIGLLMVALPVQVYRLTGSSLHVAGVTSVTAVALFAGSLAGGVIADRHDRRDVIQWSRSAAGFGFLALGLNALLPHPLLAVIYAAGVVDGLAGGVSGSALMALVPRLVGPEKVAAAGALTALTADLGTMITPAIAGLLIARTGVAPAFFIAAGATVATVGFIRAIGPQPPPVRDTQHPLRELAVGIRFAMRHPVIRPALLTGLIAMLVSGPLVLLPALAEDELDAGTTTLGLLYAAPGAGAVLGSMTSGWIGRTRHPGRALLISLALMPVGVLIAGSAPHIAVVFLGFAAFGLARAVNMVLRYAVLQRNAPEELRGRVSGLLMVQAVTGTAIGSMVAGLVGQFFAPATALVVYGLSVLILGAVAACTAGPLLRKE
ncbi:enterobactin transporter EntS [Nocardia pseudobrasiliensis]|uniref:ENTS family enterobactin (Siderophore) exporter n=1 Tax=Nocardia pseudobrasiliensis TaxID=45979 RepID=A0A370HWD5_9NOCA|nr:enterobactin transporter EntS [Nocardia pseudobrasiliensis]RDI62802.1 ENTS family enterobactin (siderophore) exporter [Nocardia pseudobrasiliensis]